MRGQTARSPVFRLSGVRKLRPVCPRISAPIFCSGAATGLLLPCNCATNCGWRTRSDVTEGPWKSLARLEMEISGRSLAQRAWKGINKNGERPARPGFISSLFSLLEPQRQFLQEWIRHLKQRNVRSSEVSLSVSPYRNAKGTV
jgi:hypothetical protein